MSDASKNAAIDPRVPALHQLVQRLMQEYVDLAQTTGPYLPERGREHLRAQVEQLSSEVAASLQEISGLTR